MSDFKVGDKIRYSSSGAVWEVRQVGVDGDPKIYLLRSETCGLALDKDGLKGATKVETVPVFEFRVPKKGERYVDGAYTTYDVLAETACRGGYEWLHICHNHDLPTPRFVLVGEGHS